ncbi:MAG: homoprotocatechuate degradation operon regulator HpaR [Leptothrix sp. (in: b-proteobacteria)]
MPDTADTRITHRNLPLLLLHARESVIAHFRPILNAHGVTEQQWRIVRALREQGALEPRQIGEHCRISSPSLAGVLSRMDDLGLVRRERLEHDQRRVRVSLTEQSEQLIEQIAPQIEAVYQQLEARLGRDFFEQVYTLLDELIEVMGPAGAAEPDA